jgi:hypothetical protein
MVQVRRLCSCALRYGFVRRQRYILCEVVDIFESLRKSHEVHKSNAEVELTWRGMKAARLNFGKRA